MILDLDRFLAMERPYWEELSTLLDRLEENRFQRLTLDQVKRLQYLYQRASSALARFSTFSAEPKTKEYLEALVARAYAECHPNRAAGQRFKPLHWLFATFPQTFRRRIVAFQLTVALTLAGVAFGSAALVLDQNAKPVLMPFVQLNESPADRVKQEEAAKEDRMAHVRGQFAAQLMTHNIQVAFFTLALGVTWGLGSGVLLFYNGVTLGAVAADYIRAGQTEFLFGWLMPHGVIEIPAILVAGQAAFVLASALIGWRQQSARELRLREVLPDVLTLAGGAAVMLVWAGIVESFISQYHKPVLPYELKIAFGSVELILLTVFLSRSGR